MLHNVRLLLLMGTVLSVAICCDAEELHSEPIGSEEPVGPVLHYTFASRTGNVVANEVGTRHPGLSRKASFTHSSLAGQALMVRKDKVPSGYVETADHEDLNAPTFTVAAWIKLRRPDSNGSVVCKHDWRNGPGRGYVLRCYTADYVNFTIGTGRWMGANGTTRLPVHQWVHVAGTFDGKALRVFYNGRQEGLTRVDEAYVPSPFPLRVGHAAYALEMKRKFDGQIDDVMIWKRALAEDEIDRVYKSQKKSRPPPLTAASIAPLVKKLGAADYQDRVAAQFELIELDTDILPLLKPLREHADPEVAWRIKKIEKLISADRPGP